jgi:hypothetical protein
VTSKMFFVVAVIFATVSSFVNAQQAGVSPALRSRFLSSPYCPEGLYGPKAGYCYDLSQLTKIPGEECPNGWWLGRWIMCYDLTRLNHVPATFENGLIYRCPVGWQNLQDGYCDHVANPKTVETEIVD